MKVQYRAADERRWETISILVEKSSVPSCTQTYAHCKRLADILRFPRTFLTKFQCSGAMYSNSVIRRRSKFFHKQIQIALSGDLFLKEEQTYKTERQKRKYLTWSWGQGSMCVAEKQHHTCWKWQQSPGWYKYHTQMITSRRSIQAGH